MVVGGGGGWGTLLVKEVRWRKEEKVIAHIYCVLSCLSVDLLICLLVDKYCTLTVKLKMYIPAEYS